MTKPRVSFCWLCSKRLRLPHHRVLVVDGVEHPVHAICLREHELKERQSAYQKQEERAAWLQRAREERGL